MQYKRFEGIEMMPSTTISAINLAKITTTATTTSYPSNANSPMHHGDNSFTMRQQSGSLDDHSDDSFSIRRSKSADNEPMDRFFSIDAFRSSTASSNRPSLV